MISDADHFVSQCDACTRLKKRAGSRCGHSALKNINKDTTPWDAFNIDSVGLWDFVNNTGKERVLTALTIIDSSAGLFETCRCPNSRKVICGQGSEFKLGFKELYETFNIMRVPLQPSKR